MSYELLVLSCEHAYREHYETNYCELPIKTFDGISIYFAKTKFDHAFFESTDRRGANDIFSDERAKRMSWIKKMLQSPQATLYQGWNRKKKDYDPCGRVSLEYEKFVVIIRLSLKRDGTLKGNFVTCFQADNSIDKIRSSPLWDREKCIEKLRKRE